MGVALAAIARALASTSSVEADITIENIAALGDAKAGDISFLANPKYTAQLATTAASAVLVSAADADNSSDAQLIVVDNPNLAFAKTAELLGLVRPAAPAGISERAVVAADAELAESVSVQAGAVIAENVTIGAGSAIHPNVTIGSDVIIGQRCIIYPNVTIMDGSRIGDAVIINAGTVVGSDGFGFDMESPQNIKIPQVGNVVIGSGSEIGANVTIDRARFGSTVIGENVKIDNLVQIAHNVVIGPHSVIVAQSGVAGSSVLGAGVVTGGATAIAGHLTIAAKTMLAARSGVTKSIDTPGIYAGFPAQSANSWRKDIANIRSLGKIRKTLKDLKERIVKIEHPRPENS